MTAPYVVEPLAASHDRAGFDCGVAPLNLYFQTQVGQDMRRRLTACFVAVDVATGGLAGYYTLATTGIPLTEVGAALRSQLPRYPLVPAVRLGRLAVDRRQQGRGAGGMLLFDGLRRSIRSDITASALVVDAEDDGAAAFYRHHGFMPFESAARTLFLPLAEVARRIG